MRQEPLGAERVWPTLDGRFGLGRCWWDSGRPETRGAGPACLGGHLHRAAGREMGGEEWVGWQSGPLARGWFFGESPSLQA